MSDQKGDKAVVYDCIVNPEVVTNAENDESGNDKDFLVQLCLQYVESKYKCQLDRRYKLPKMKYKTANGKDGIDTKKVETQREGHVRRVHFRGFVVVVVVVVGRQGQRESGKAAPKGARKVHDVVGRAALPVTSAGRRTDRGGGQLEGTERLRRRRGGGRERGQGEPARGAAERRRRRGGAARFMVVTAGPLRATPSPRTPPRSWT